MSLKGTQLKGQNNITHFFSPNDDALLFKESTPLGSYSLLGFPQPGWIGWSAVNDFSLIALCV